MHVLAAPSRCWQRYVPLQAPPSPYQDVEGTGGGGLLALSSRGGRLQAAKGAGRVLS